MANELEGRRVAMRIAPVGTEQVAFAEPEKAVEDAGAQVDVVGLQSGEAQTTNSDVNPGETFTVEKTLSEASVNDYDVLIVPGGSVGRTTSGVPIALVRLGKGLSLAKPKLLLYPLLVEPDDPAVADLYHRHPRLPGLADHVSCCLRVALQVHGLL